MRARWVAGLFVIFAAIGCSKREPEPEKPAMKVEDTVFGDLVGAQDKARDRTNEAMDAHRKALEAQVNESEAPPPEE
jgi:hypothetical protein